MLSSTCRWNERNQLLASSHLNSPDHISRSLQFAGIKCTQAPQTMPKMLSTNCRNHSITAHFEWNRVFGNAYTLLTADQIDYERRHNWQSTLNGNPQDVPSPAVIWNWSADDEIIRRCTYGTLTVFISTFSSLKLMRFWFRCTDTTAHHQRWWWYMQRFNLPFIVRIEAEEEEGEELL